MRTAGVIALLFLAVGTAFVLGLFVGVRHGPDQAPEVPRIAQMDGGDQTSPGAGEADEAGETDPADGEPPGGAEAIVRDDTQDEDTEQADSRETPDDTWLTESTPEPGGPDAKGAGKARNEGDPAQPTVLTGADAEPGGGVYAVQTLDAMRRARGLALSRALSQGPYEAELVPVYSDASPGDEGYRTHVRLGLFTDREAARTAAEQARRTVDARLGVVRVSRAATGPDAPAASASGGEEAAGGDTTAAEGDG